MLNKADFVAMRREVQAYDEKRELLIKKSRDVLKLSKQVIYAVHRDELKAAEKLIQQIQKEKAALEKIAGNDHQVGFRLPGRNNQRDEILTTPILQRFQMQIGCMQQAPRWPATICHCLYSLFRTFIRLLHLIKSANSSLTNLKLTNIRL